MTELDGHYTTKMAYAQEWQQENADQHGLPAPSFRVGNKV